MTMSIRIIGSTGDCIDLSHCGVRVVVNKGLCHVANVLMLVHFVTYKSRLGVRLCRTFTIHGNIMFNAFLQHGARTNRSSETLVHAMKDRRRHVSVGTERVHETVGSIHLHRIHVGTIQYGGCGWIVSCIRGGCQCIPILTRVRVTKIVASAKFPIHATRGTIQKDSWFDHVVNDFV
eukprot:scaffold9813_cov144-Amphora_coffeaeformis.AAC.1